MSELVYVLIQYSNVDEQFRYLCNPITIPANSYAYYTQIIFGLSRVFLLPAFAVSDLSINMDTTRPSMIPSNNTSSATIICNNIIP